jgi:hypothetical protein
MLVAGCWLVDVGWWMLVGGCWLVDVGWWMFKARRSVEEFSSWDRAFAVPIMETALLSQG